MLHRDMATQTKSPPKRRKRKPDPSTDGHEQAKTIEQLNMKIEGLKYFEMLAVMLQRM
jgi:hypothetical protein